MKIETNNNSRGIGSVLLIACIPMIVGFILSVYVSKEAALTEINTNMAVLGEKISSNKELMLNLLAESEKRRTDQYQYLCNETQEIKEQLKQKKNISMLMLGDSIFIYPEMEYMVTRGSYISRWIDTLHHYKEINDSLYVVLCLNLHETQEKLK